MPRSRTGKAVDGAWVFPNGLSVKPGDHLDVRHMGGHDPADPMTYASNRPRIKGVLLRIPSGASPYFVLEVDPSALPPEVDPEYRDGLHYCTASEILGTLPGADLESWLAQ